MIRHLVVPTYLLACLLLGGASAAGYTVNLLLQLAAIPIIGWALWTLAQTGIPTAIRAPLALWALLVLIALVQLIPLPPSIWTLLPGRGSVVEGYRLLEMPLPWLPLSLAPGNSLASLLWLLPAFAIFLATVVLGAFRGRGVAIVVVAVTLVSVALGALQVVSGGSAYIYEITNYGAAVGFFANSNHNATLLLVSIPFLAALQKALLKRHRSPRNVSAIRLMISGAYAVILVGLLINASLAGIGLGVPITLVTWLVFGKQRPIFRRLALGITAIGTVAAILTIVIGPFGNNLFGKQGDQANFSRQTSFSRTLDAAGDYLPVGSGVGTFQSIYRTQEPLSTVTPFYMNHAHSDWIELLLETGLPGIALAVLFLIWWSVRARAVWGADEREPFAQAAIIAGTAIMLHSMVDYPLRTAALSAVFALCVGLVSGVRPYVRPRPASATKSGARHISI
ncbi:O-antigen ligase family protein [Novosphingopyxis sp. YJ-S2-01]|uniref:O-antigen ligase family protein n=1 Tax=Novosphingopyxis sp. YJ-S2-01 TaxID=2794021 RepID=UPI0018DBBCB8|nr:O-antigen ligase family protein [Novosphingopyxis sp. YJ-S2-01]MBH9538432.1 O-antigen ligase family protein [Novosphingopyxis sp. YJ-S2-01]